MPQSSAERVAAFRRRQVDRIAELELTVSAQVAELAEARTEIGRLKQERERLYGLLEEASAAPQDAGGPRTPDCPHPAALVDGDRCGGCGQLVDTW